MEEKLLVLRSRLSKMIKDLDDWGYARGQDNSEVFFALQHVKEARMNLGVMLAKVRKQDPWADELTEELKEDK